MAQRYGQLPITLLRLPLDDWSIVVRVWDAGVREDDRQRKEAERKSKRR